MGFAKNRDRIAVLADEPEELLIDKIQKENEYSLLIVMILVMSLLLMQLPPFSMLFVTCSIFMNLLLETFLFNPSSMIVNRNVLNWLFLNAERQQLWIICHSGKILKIWPLY